MPELAQEQAPFDIEEPIVPEVSAATPPQEPASDRPRNADGTFKASPKHASFLVEVAKDHGFADDEIEAMTPAALGRLAHVLQRQELEHTRQALAESAIHETRGARPVVPDPEPKPEEELGLDEAQYDPGLVGVLKKLHAENKALRGRLTEGEEREQRRAQSERSRAIDAAFAKLGPDFQEHFGEGDIFDLPMESAERAKREAVVSLALQQKDGSLPARIAKVAKQLFGAKAKPTADPSAEYEAVAKPGKNGKPRITPEQWREAGTAVPTQRKELDLPAGDDKATRNLERRMREQETPDSVELEGFL